jgi:peptide/nickel transport system substrate-binding protein
LNALFGVISEMKKFRWQLIIIFITGLVIGILLLVEKPGSRVLSIKPTAGGTYTEALIGSFHRLNPLLDSQNAPDKDIDRLIFSSLLKFDSRGIASGDLASAWGISQDGTIYNFSIRDDANWHDGNPVTSEDVAFTLDYFIKGASFIPPDIQAFWQDVKMIVASKKNFQLILPEPFAPFLDYLTFGILPKHLLENATGNALIDDSFNLHPIGSGPYVFDRLITENGQIKGVVIKANPGYFGSKPFIEEIDFLYYPDSRSAFSDYREGIVAGISYVDRDLIPVVLAQPGLAVYSGRNPNETMVLFNLKEPTATFLQDVIVRKALFTGLDRQGMINELLQGQGIVADGPIFPGTWAYYDGIKHISYDPVAAKNLLIQNGYVVASGEDAIREKNGIKIIFTLLYPEDSIHQSIAQYIQRNWENLDIRVDLEAVPYDQLISERLAQKNYQAALVDFNFSDMPDPDPYPMWDQSQITGGQNYSQWDNRIASEYLEDARITIDLDSRIKLYRNFQVIFSQELPALPIFYPVYTFAVNSQVMGISMGPLWNSSDRFSTIMNWYMLASKPQSQITSEK